MKKLLLFSLLLFTAISFGQIPIHLFKFENNLTNSANTVTLAPDQFSPITYAVGFNGSGNSLLLNQRAVSGIIPNAPIGNNSKSFGCWVKRNNNNSPQYMIFGTGTNSSAQQSRGLNLEIFDNILYVTQGYEDILASPSFVFDTNWHYYVVTYNGPTNFMRLYIDAIAVSETTLSFPQNTIGTELIIGGNNDNMVGGNLSVDEFSIYNFALNQQEVTSLFSSLSNTDFNTKNLKFSMYPNPSSDVVTIDFENDIDSVEIYSLQGQKVMTSNQKQINISQFNSGIYMVKVQGQNGAIATQKLIKK